MLVKLKSEISGQSDKFKNSRGLFQKSMSSTPLLGFFLEEPNTDSILKSTHNEDFQYKTICGIFVQLSKQPPYVWPLEIILK